MQVESQALNRAKALLVKLANPTPPKARGPSTELNQYFSSIDPTHQSQNAFGSGDTTLADIKNLPKNYMTEAKQTSCDDEKKSYARLASDKTRFKKNNLENSRKSWKMKKQQLDTSVGDDKREKSRQKSTENKIKEFITAFNADKMKSNGKSNIDPRIWENKENQMKKSDINCSRIRSNKQSSSSFLSFQTETQETQTRKDSSINLSMESGTRNRTSSGASMGKMPALVFKENLKDIVASQLRYSKQNQQQNTVHHKRDQSATRNHLDEVHKPKAKSISLANQQKKSTPCPNPSLREVESESLIVDEKNTISFISENRKTVITTPPFVKENQDKTTSRTSVNVSIDFLAKLLHSKRIFSYTPGNASFDLSLIEGQKADPAASVSLLDHLIKYHNESTSDILNPVIENKNIAQNLVSDAEQRPSSCIGISKPYHDLRRPRPQEPSQISPISQKIEKISIITKDQPSLPKNDYHSIQVEQVNKDRLPIEGYKSVPYKRNYHNFEKQAVLPKVENLDRLLKLKYGYNSDLPRIPKPSLVDQSIPNRTKKPIEEIRLHTNIEPMTETNRHEVFQTQQSTIDDEQKHSELCTNISFCNEREDTPPNLPPPRSPGGDHDLKELRAIFLPKEISSESLEEDSLEVNPKIIPEKSTNRTQMKVDQSFTQKTLPTTNREFETERNLSVSRRSYCKNPSHLQFHEIRVLYQNDHKEQILSEFLNEETLICDYSPCFEQNQYSYDNE